MPDCKTCKTERRQAADVPYIVHESDMARLERTIKRLWVLLLVVIVLLVGSNIAWVVYENQSEEVVTTTQEVEQDTDGGGNNIFVGGDNYGEAKSKDNDH